MAVTFAADVAGLLLFLFSVLLGVVVVVLLLKEDENEDEIEDDEGDDDVDECDVTDDDGNDDADDSGCGVRGGARCGNKACLGRSVDVDYIAAFRCWCSCC